MERREEGELEEGGNISTQRENGHRLGLRRGASPAVLFSAISQLLPSSPPGFTADLHQLYRWCGSKRLQRGDGSLRQGKGKYPLHSKRPPDGSSAALAAAQAMWPGCVSIVQAKGQDMPPVNCARGISDKAFLYAC